MAGGQERVLRRRIRSVESTKKITRAMELIAASRIVRAQQAIAAARPYVAKMGEVVAHLAGTPDAAGHPLFREAESARTVAIIVITADRGLAGGYNSSVIRIRRAPPAPASGRRSRGPAGCRRPQGRKLLPIPESAHSGLGDRGGAIDPATRTPVGWWRRSCNRSRRPSSMRSTSSTPVSRPLGSQMVTERQLVPMPREDLAPQHRPATDRWRRSATPRGHKTDYEFEPEPAEILDRLLPSWLESEILAAMLETPRRPSTRPASGP